MSKIIPMEIIAPKILIIRKHRVILDKDIACLYGVKPIALRQQVKRNIDRFPDDFMFQLSKEEVNILVSQNVIPSLKTLGGYLPYAFTEQGVAMLSSVLRSKRAIQVNMQIMRTFIKLKELILTNVEFAQRLKLLEHKFIEHDDKIIVIFKAIEKLLEPSPVPEKPKIGFHPNK